MENAGPLWQRVRLPMSAGGQSQWRRHLITVPYSVLQFVLIYVLRPFPVLVTLTTGFGAAVRVLNILCFVLVLQALLLAAMPHQGGARLMAVERHLVAFLSLPEGLSPAMLAAGLVIVSYLLLLGCHIAYQKVLGRLVARAGARLSHDMDLSALADAKARTLITTATTNGIKVSEVVVFQVLMFALIFVFDFRIALILGIGCAAALVAIVIVRKSSIAHRNDIQDSRRDYFRSHSREGALATAYHTAQERLRYRQGVAPGWDAMVLGVVVAAVIVLLSIFEVDIMEHAAYAILLVFAMRFAIIYTRDLAKSLSALFDLRTDQTLKAAMRKEDKSKRGQ